MSNIYKFSERNILTNYCNPCIILKTEISVNVSVQSYFKQYLGRIIICIFIIRVNINIKPQL